MGRVSALSQMMSVASVVVREDFLADRLKISRFQFRQELLRLRPAHLLLEVQNDLAESLYAVAPVSLQRALRAKFEGHVEVKHDGGLAHLLPQGCRQADSADERSFILEEDEPLGIEFGPLQREVVSELLRAGLGRLPKVAEDAALVVREGLEVHDLAVPLELCQNLGLAAAGGASQNADALGPLKDGGRPSSKALVTAL
mmetsp:Transcript_25781/g.39215  ORF Transcript_25781/g.39215 Transcript_25781/m.39215 type:complete len:200 (+) Transcript_25781:341-940(+)